MKQWTEHYGLLYVGGMAMVCDCICGYRPLNVFRYHLKTTNQQIQFIYLNNMENSNNKSTNLLQLELYSFL